MNINTLKESESVQSLGYLYDFFVILINHFYLVDYKKTINTKKVFFNYYEEDFLLWNLSILFNNI